MLKMVRLILYLLKGSNYKLLKKVMLFYISCIIQCKRNTVAKESISLASIKNKEAQLSSAILDKKKCSIHGPDVENTTYTYSPLSSDLYSRAEGILIIVSFS